MNGIDQVWENVSRRAPPSRRVLIASLRAYLATCDTPHAMLLSGRDVQGPPDEISARALELGVMEQYGRLVKSRQDLADWMRLLYDAENELIRGGATLSTTRLAAFPPPQASPFNPDAMRASQRVALWRHALGKWFQSAPSDKTREEWRAAIAISAILHGGLLDTTKVKGLHAMLDGSLTLKEAAGYAFVEFDMPFEGMGNHHLQRWFIDPVTEMLVLRLPANDAFQPSGSLATGIRRLLLSNGVEKDKCPVRLGDLISSANTWWSCRAAQIDLHAIRRTFCTHSIHPRTAQRLFGYQAECHRLTSNNVDGTAYDETTIVEDTHVLHPWLAESVSHLYDVSSDAPRENIDALFSQQPDDALGKVYLGWLRFMLSGNSASKSALALSTIRKRYIAATERLLAMLGNDDPRGMNTRELEDIYGELALEESPDHPVGRLAQGLSDFHFYLVRVHGKKHISKPSQVFGDDASRLPVDANLVSFDDYLEARSWLDTRLAEGADPDDTTTCQLVMAMAFRLGMRRMEIFGLRLNDIQVRKGMVCLVRPHPGRRLKTANSKRVIPIDAFFDWRERRLLKAWVARRQAEVARLELPAESQCSQYLFSVVEGAGAEKRVSVDGIVDRICEALRAVTGDQRIFLHHLRHAFGTWTYLRLRGPDYPMVASFFPHLPETAKAIRQGRRLRLQLLGTRGTPSRTYAHAVARLLGHSSPQVSMGHYVHSCDMILAAIVHREMAGVPRVELVAASGLPAATAYRHLEASAHDLVLSVRRQYQCEDIAASRQVQPDNRPRSKGGRPAKRPPHERPEWLPLAKVWSVLHLAGKGGIHPAEIGGQLGLEVDRVESILSHARVLGPLIGLSVGADEQAPCPAKLRYAREKALAQELEPRLAGVAVKDPQLYIEGLELHLRHFNRQKHDVVFRGEKEAAALQRYLKFLTALGLDCGQLQWVIRAPESATPAPPPWVGGVGAPWLPARVRRIAPPAVGKASTYAQWAGLQVVDENGQGLGKAMAVILFQARV